MIIAIGEPWEPWNVRCRCPIHTDDDELPSTAGQFISHIAQTRHQPGRVACDCSLRQATQAGIGTTGPVSPSCVAQETDVLAAVTQAFEPRIAAGIGAPVGMVFLYGQGSLAADVVQSFAGTSPREQQLSWVEERGVFRTSRPSVLDTELPAQTVAIGTILTLLCWFVTPSKSHVSPSPGKETGRDLVTCSRRENPAPSYGANCCVRHTSFCFFCLMCKMTRDGCAARNNAPMAAFALQHSLGDVSLLCL